MATTMTYNEWLAKQQAAANEIKTESIGAANKGYASALYNGALQQQMSAPTYGATAEALASRGMANSGYSNYLANNAQETFNKTATVAQQTRNASTAGANKLYDKTMQDVKEQAYQTFLKGIDEGGSIDANGNLIQPPSSADVQAAFDSGALTKEYYDQLTTALNTNYLPLGNAWYKQGTNGALRKYSDVMAELKGGGETWEKNIDSDPMLTPVNKEKIKNLVTYFYTPYTSDRFTVDADELSDIKFDEDGYYEIGTLEDKDGNEIDDIRLKEISGEELDGVAEIASDNNASGVAVPDGQFFLYNGEIYLNRGGGAFARVDFENRRKDGDWINLLDTFADLPPNYFEVTGFEKP